MNIKMRKIMGNLFLLIFAVSSVYAGDSIVKVDKGTFEELPEERKQKVKEIQRQFDDEVESVMLSKNNKCFMSIVESRLISS